MFPRLSLSLLGALLATCVFAASASAVVLTPTISPLSGSNFQGGDGNQADPDGAGSLVDWQNIAGSATSTADDNALDTMFEGGDKETEPYHWARITKADGVTPSKDNVFVAWSSVDSSSADVFLNLAFQREASTGNTFAAFELNQRTDSWVNDRGTSIPCRTTGDILIAYNVQSGGSPPNVDVVIYRWTSLTTNGAQGCGRTGSFEEFDPQPFAQGAINAADIDNFLPDAVLNSNGDIEEGEFGEASINLTGLFEAEFDNPCFAFGQVQMHTRSAVSIDSQLQDLVGPEPLLARSCSIHVEKSGPDTVQHGEQMQFTFDVTNDGNVPLTDISVSDDHCPDGNITDPVKTGGDQDDILENDPTVEHWTYTCTMDVPDHADGEEDPIVNTVTATGHAGDNEVSDDSTHSTDILHPDIDIDKKVSLDAAGPFSDGPIEAGRDATLYYEFTVTNPGEVPLSVALNDARCDSAAVLQSGDDDSDGKLDTDETWVYTCSHALQPGDPDPFSNHACAVGTPSSGSTVEACDDTETDVLHPAIHVDKTVRVGSSGAFSESVKAHVGDTLEYQFVVTNTGDTPLDVTLSDPKCDSGTLTFTGGDANSDGKLDLTETWSYSCSHKLTSADLAASSEFPNVATAAGTDSQNQHVSDDDGANATILDPRINIDKVVRVGDSGAFADTATAEVGQTLTYQLTVTNTGNTPLAVNVSDPRCDSSPEYRGGDSDGDNMLDLSEAWVFTCTHVVTASDPDPLVNTSTADGTDELGGKASDDDTATTDILPPVGGVAPETIRPGVATLVGKTGCVARGFTARVSGRSIVKVVFKIDGKTVKTLRKPNSGSRFTYKVNPAGLKNGAHRLEATVSFDTKTGTRAKRLRVTFLRCARKVAPPRFTG